MPAPRKNESAAGGAAQRILAWPFRAILAFLIWTGIRPYQLTLLSSILQAHVAQVSLRQNTDMRKITAWAAIITVPTMLAGIWGMNFKHMPELQWRFGYPLALAVIIGSSLTLLRAFKKSGWL